jgi:hypothetical protein
MRHLIDSQSLMWYVDQDHLLSPTAHAAITDPANELLLSAATIWEIAIKVGLKKLALSLPYRQWMYQAMADDWPIPRTRGDLAAVLYQGRHSRPYICGDREATRRASTS